MPGKPDIALASMGIYVFKTKLLIECCARTRQIRIRRTISARTSSPHWSRAARLWRTCSPTAACAPGSSPSRIGARRHHRRVLGGECRPDRLHPGARSAQGTTGRFGRTPRSRRPPSSSTTRTRGAGSPTGSNAAARWPRSQQLQIKKSVFVPRLDLRQCTNAGGGA